MGANVFVHLLPAVRLRLFELLRLVCFFRFLFAGEEDIHRIGYLFLNSRLLRPENLQDALIGFFFGLGFIAQAFLLLNHADGIGYEVADDLFDVAAYVSDFRIFRRFDLDEGSADEPGQASGNFRLADACRADEQDIFRNNFILHFFVQPLAAPAVAQGDSYGFLRFLLAYDVFIQFCDNLLRCQFDFVHVIPSSLVVIFLLR